MTYSYSIYGLCVHSDIPLAVLPTGSEVADVTVSLGSLETVSPDSIDQGMHVLGELEGIAKVQIEAGNKITVAPLPGVEETRLGPSILGGCMAVILEQRGFLVLHASCVEINGKAIAFMGHSGWGKSTLAAAFHRQGYPVLTDDVMAVRVEAGSPMVTPSFPSIKLWPEAAESLGQDPQQFTKVSKASWKLNYPVQQGFKRKIVPLHRIYVLAKGTQHAIVPLAPQLAFQSLLRHGRAPNVLSSSAFVKSHLRYCTELINNVSIRKFIRKPSLAEMPELIELIKADLAADTPEVSNKPLLV